MTYVTNIQSNDHIGKTVTVRGWVHTVRDMGKIAFIDLRDQTGLLQVVIPSDDLPKLGLEYVIEVTGTVRERGERFRNDKLATGTIELGATTITVLNTALELPFEIKKDTAAINEELRLKYRYLDLRTERMARNLRLRHDVVTFFRDYLNRAGFTEVETPMLNKGTPEGAREFLVPSRLHPEEFYVLPQSPQQFKQLLMIAGLGRYYQIARAFRDEDQRGDRQPEFTQLDIEMSFVTQEDILALNEAMFIELVKTIAPDKHITSTPFPRLTYLESMEKYGSDKPDLRQDKTDPNELAFAWVTDFPMFEKDESGKGITSMHHPFTSPKQEDLSLLDSDPLAVRADAYDLVLNGYELSSGSIRIHGAALQQKIFEVLGLTKAEITAKFGHMIEAFKYGAPPHGGMAPGIDRVVMILAGEPNIREVIAFPKTGDARDPLTGAPARAAESALAQVHIKTIPPAKK
jgi:aspartyl-tRNA synthetase